VSVWSVSVGSSAAGEVLVPPVADEDRGAGEHLAGGAVTVMVPVSLLSTDQLAVGDVPGCGVERRAARWDRRPWSASGRG
jgi:hypothetical protein